MSNLGAERTFSSMTRIVYFDTNVFDHLYKQSDGTNTDFHTLRSAVKAGRISILPSFLNFDETLSALKRFPDLAKTEIRLILDLVDSQRLLKPPHVLLSDAIRCYANGDVLPDPFLPFDHSMQTKLQCLANLSQEDIAELLIEVVNETKMQKEDFRTGMKEAKEKVLPFAKGAPQSFSEYWERLSEKFAEGLAEHEGLLEECGARGIKGLLEIRSIKLCIGIQLSFAYALTYEGRAPQIGDAWDQKHAVQAAATDTFVTQDQKFARLMKRIPIDGFEVLDLQGLIQQIAR